MLRNFVVLATVCLCLVAAVHKETFTADKNYLMKQKSIYQLLWHIDQPTTVNPELYQTARAWNVEEHLAAYPGHEHVVHEFVQRWKWGLLPHDVVFTAYHPEHMEEVEALFNVFYWAKDFDTFYNMALWARYHVNPYLYGYALSVAVLHRPDTRHIRLPPLYEIVPHLFFNNEVFQMAYRAKMGDASLKKSIDMKYHEGTDLIIHSNYSGWYIVHDDAEEKLSYFTEDIGLNSYYFYFTHEFPRWMDSENYTLPKSIRGEYYHYGHRHLLARYYLERLSHDMGEIETIDVHEPIMTGYYPTMNLPNGLPFAQRPSWSHVPHYMHNLMHDIEEYESRIHAAIDAGYILDDSTPPKHVSIYTPEGLNLLGNLIEGNMDSPNLRFYGSVDQLARRILGFSPEPIDKNYLIPSALDFALTSLRDPAFYRIYKIIVNYFLHYKEHLPKYTREDLLFNGVKVESVTVDKLVTYFEHYDSDISNGIPVSSMKDAETLAVKVRQHRLNHKPFTYHIGVTSDKNVKAMIRIFLGPKYDHHGHEIDFVNNWMNFFEIDQFVVELKSGTNKIKRGCHESVYIMPDDVSSVVYWKKLITALDGGESLQYNGQLYGFPDRLLLPRGKREGLPLKLFIFVSPFDDATAVTVDSPIWGSAVADPKPMGYPLDRPVWRQMFHSVPNAYFKDIIVFHKQVEELNQTV